MLLSLLAVLALLLGSGTAISLTAGAPGATRAGSERAALGTAPTLATTAAPTAADQDSGYQAAAGRPPENSPTPPAETDAAEESAGGQDAGSDSAADASDERTALEDEVTRITNQEREGAGCPPVSTDERLRTAAREHSEDMAANDYFSHTGLDGRSPFDRMGDAGYPNPAGENIAYGYRTPAEVMDGWMNSDGHRDNLLTCSHQAIGVGLAFDPNGRPYWTQVFGR